MSADRLIKLLSTAFRKDKDSNNYKLLKVLIEGFDEIEEQLELIKQMRGFETAYGKSLDYIASIFNIRRQNETDEEFRYRIILERFKHLSCGTKSDIVNILDFIGLKYKNVKEPPELDPATFMVYIDASTFFEQLEENNLTSETFVRIIQDILNAVKPAGVRALLGFNYKSKATTKTRCKNVFEVDLVLSQRTDSIATNSFDLTVKAQTETKSSGEVKLGYGFWGYGEYGYGGVW